MHVNRFDDKACLRGALYSIIKDCTGEEQTKKEIKKEIENKTQGAVTSIFPGDVEGVVKKLFNTVRIINVNNRDDLNKISPVDNNSSFGLIFFKGDGNINRHAVRLIDNSNDSIYIMDATKQLDEQIEFDKIFEFSPQGFDLVILEQL